jgi:mRNA interferase RelE/StbE
MTYRVVLSRRASCDLHETLPEAVAAAVIDFLRGPLAENPHRVGKPLRNELSDQWSARRGQYRIVYVIHEQTVVVTIVRMSHRRDAYRG